MRVLGIDPGTLYTGYGIVEEDSRSRICMINCGVILAPQKMPIEQRLCHMHDALVKLIIEFKPDVVAIEEPFVANNARTALSIGRAQAVAILAAVQAGLHVERYMPTEVKQMVTSYGRSSKQQVQEVVKLQLGITGLPEATDAADALAVAICHLNQQHTQEIIKRGH